MNAQEIDALVAKAQSGDRDAFRSLMLELQQPVRLALIWSAPTTEMLEEVVQGAFVTAFQNLANYRLEGTFLAWLKGIARNLLARELQARRRLVQLDGDLLEQQLFTLPENDHPDDAIDSLRTCLDSLAPRARAMIEQRYGQDQDLARLAARFHQPKGTIAVNLFRIREQLRECLAGKGITA